MNTPTGQGGPDQVIETPLGVAQSILRLENVFPTEKMEKIFGTISLPRCPIPYSVKTLERCARRNKQGDRWILICRTGSSILEMKKKFRNQFVDSQALRLKTLSDEPNPHLSILAHRDEPAYRLINLRPSFVASRDLLSPNHIMSRLRSYHWTYLTTVVQGLLAYHAVNGVRLMQNTSHISVGYGEFLLVGDYEKAGMMLYTMPMDLQSRKLGIPDAGIVLCRKPNT